jgi:hypothetical protein
LTNEALPKQTSLRPMFEQVLQRSKVLEQLERVKSELSRPRDTRRRQAGPKAPTVTIDGEEIVLTPDDLKLAAEELEKAQRRESIELSGQPGFPLISTRRGMPVPALDNRAFVSREPAIGLLQSALELYQLDKAPANSTRSSSIRRGGEEWRPGATRRLLNEFSQTDPRWLASVVAMGLKLFRKPHPFKENPVDIRIGNQARMIVVGDWGSGIDRAKKIAQMMRAVIEEGSRDNCEQHVVHLGDVYYSGWGWECQERFLDQWPVNTNEADTISSWSLNGNHDMYSGGYGYFDRVLGDSRFHRQGGASYFRLFNDDWQFLGLDTAYRENELREPQSDWIRQTVDEKRKTMLLSHHQPFTVYEKDSIKMDATLEGVLRNNGVQAWLFGHEHRCIVYNETLKIRHPRLIGHGGVPVYMLHRETDPFTAPVAYEYRKYIPGGIKGIEHWAPFGFAVLDLDGPKINARYFYEDSFIYPDKKNPPDLID